jgi:hypothetical protein
MVFGGVTLPWEWSKENRIRNTLYPYYLSIPLRLLKYFELDDVNTVRNSYYVAHALLVIVGDYFFIKVGKSLVGNFSTKVSLYYYLTNKFYNSHIIHAFINSTESILTLALFHFYLKKRSLILIKIQ